MTHNAFLDNASSFVLAVMFIVACIVRWRVQVALPLFRRQYRWSLVFGSCLVAFYISNLFLVTGTNLLLRTYLFRIVFGAWILNTGIYAPRRALAVRKQQDDMYLAQIARSKALLGDD